MNALQKIDDWHKTTKGYVIFGIVELIAAYITGSAAIDTGSILLWIVTIVLIIGGFQNILKAVAGRGKR